MLRPGKHPSSNGYPDQAGGGYYNNDYSYSNYNQNYQQQQQSYGGGYSSGYPQNGGGYDVYSQPKEPPRRSQAESSFMSLLKNKLLWTLLLCFILFCLTLYHHKQHKTVLTKLKVSSVDEAERLFQDTERERSKWKKDSHVNMHAQEEYKKTIGGLSDENRKLKEESKVSSKREEAMRYQIELLQNATSRESKRAVVEKFGPGPHKVRLTFKLPTTDKAGKTTFVMQNVVVEMAPLDLVPHAIHLFLEQVSHNLWDKTFVYLNGPHILQFGPTGMDNMKKGSTVQKFVDQKLDKLAFPEYSPEFPHLPYTLGFTGRPGGPDFYINKGNNTVPHGPGGQAQHGLTEQADPCFASVVEGQGVIQKLYLLPTFPPKSEYGYFFKEPIEMTSARIISTKKPPVQQQQAKPKQQQANTNANAKNQVPPKQQQAQPKQQQANTNTNAKNQVPPKQQQAQPKQQQANTNTNAKNQAQPKQQQANTNTNAKNQVPPKQQQAQPKQQQANTNTNAKNQAQRKQQQANTNTNAKNQVPPKQQQAQPKQQQQQAQPKQQQQANVNNNVKKATLPSQKKQQQQAQPKQQQQPPKAQGNAQAMGNNAAASNAAMNK